jgi:hypothetical protein
MKQQESNPWAENPISELQPLNFKPVHPSDPRLVAYQALIKSPAPGIPMFSVTVSAASPGDDQQAERELQSLLSNMRAGLLVTEGGPVQDAPDDPKPFNPDTEIEIKIELVEQGTTERTFGVIMAIQTAVDSGTEAEADQAALAAARSAHGTVPKGRDHKYTAPRRMWATVTSISGSGSVRSPVDPVPAGGTGYAYGRTVYVHGYTYMKYTISPGWTDRGLT